MQKYGFPLTHILLYNLRDIDLTESAILSFYGKIRVSENPCSRMFYAVKSFSNLRNTIKIKLRAIVRTIFRMDLDVKQAFK